MTSSFNDQINGRLHKACMETFDLTFHWAFSVVNMCEKTNEMYIKILSKKVKKCIWNTHVYCRFLIR